MKQVTSETVRQRMNEIGQGIATGRISLHEPMNTITREQLLNQALENVKALELAVVQSAFKEVRPAIEIDLELARIALASLEAEAVAEVVAWSHPSEERTRDIRWRRFDVAPGLLYAAPPAPAVMKDHQIRELVNKLRDVAIQYHDKQQLRERIAHSVRAAMQGKAVK